MFVCSEHGQLATEWCDPCQKIVACDCSKTTYTRFKDMIFDCDDGERTITIRLYHCATCGEPSHAEI